MLRTVSCSKSLICFPMPSFNCSGHKPDRLPVVVRFPAGLQVSLKCGDQSKTMAPARKKLLWSQTPRGLTCTAPQLLLVIDRAFTTLFTPAISLKFIHHLVWKFVPLWGATWHWCDLGFAGRLVVFLVVWFVSRDDLQEDHTSPVHTAFMEI